MSELRGKSCPVCRVTTIAHDLGLPMRMSTRMLRLSIPRNHECDMQSAGGRPDRGAEDGSWCGGSLRKCGASSGARAPYRGALNWSFVVGPKAPDLHHQLRGPECFWFRLVNCHKSLFFFPRDDIFHLSSTVLALPRVPQPRRKFPPDKPNNRIRS